MSPTVFLIIFGILPKPCRRCIFFIILENLADPTSPLTLLFGYQHDDPIQPFGIWFGLRSTSSDDLYRFREVLPGNLL